jgi:hypothetical protein
MVRQLDLIRTTTYGGAPGKGNPQCNNDVKMY